MKIQIEPLNKSNLEDFFVIHSLQNNHDWCFCVAWHLDTWDGWDVRTAENNKNLRQKVNKNEEYDGFLLYVDKKPAAWAQVSQRDSFPKLLRQYKLTPDPLIWAITCFFMIPSYRKKGLTHKFLSGIMENLRDSGIKKIQAFPKCGNKEDDGDVWTGPEAIFLKAGFSVEKNDTSFPIYSFIYDK